MSLLRILGRKALTKNEERLYTMFAIKKNRMSFLRKAATLSFAIFSVIRFVVVVG